MDDLPGGSLHVRLSSAIESMDQLFEQINNIVQREDRERLCMNCSDVDVC